MQQIKWFCDRCKKETDKLGLTRVEDTKDKPFKIGPRYNGYYLSGADISWHQSVDFDLCQDCLNKVKEFIQNV